MRCIHTCWVQRTERKIERPDSPGESMTKHTRSAIDIYTTAYILHNLCIYCTTTCIYHTTTCIRFQTCIYTTEPHVYIQKHIYIYIYIYCILCFIPVGCSGRRGRWRGPTAPAREWRNRRGLQSTASTAPRRFRTPAWDATLPRYPPEPVSGFMVYGVLLIVYCWFFMVCGLKFMVYRV